MYLKRLEIVGFKSFAQKTTFDFHGGIAGIVGPNGSGKSNVIDAMRWILGEREAKNLRGAKAEDLIFAGTAKRPRMGMAQVQITFDNSSGVFPVDFKEVAITRRIERNDSSKYFLNNVEVRMKDIIDFFAKVRLGTRGLSIINQGSSDLFVRVTPAERRMMIEEILGLRQYQLKKHEAERKLKNTSINVEKVKAMVEEIAPHLRFLKKQTSKWEKLADLQGTLKEYENVYFGNKLKETHDGLEKYAPQIQQIDNALEGKEKELSEIKKALEKVESSQPKEKVDTVRKKREVLLKERWDIEREVSKLEAKIEFLNSVAATGSIDLRAGELVTALEDVAASIEYLLKEKDIAVVHTALRELLQKVHTATDHSSKKKGEVEDVRKIKDALLKKLAPIREALDALTATEETSTHDLESFNKEFRSAFEQVEHKKDEMIKLEGEKNKLLFEVERFNLRKQDMEMQISQIGRKMSEFEALSKNPTPTDDIADLERKMLRLRGEIASIGDVDTALIKEAQETESRHAFLAQQIEDLEKASTDLGSLIKELDHKIDEGFTSSLKKINEAFDKFFNMMFGGGKAKLFLEKPTTLSAVIEDEEMAVKEIEPEPETEDDDEVKQLGIEIDVSLPRKKIRGLDMLSGGEKSLVSIAALFALISVSPPPFLVLDEVDAALDEKNTKRFADIVHDFAKKTQFVIVTHNRATMEVADVLYGVTMEEDGVSKMLSIKLE
ncbi:MAG: AAA family ATPase [bacterium]|nr:AAA family ATPase [bacterium]